MYTLVVFNLSCLYTCTRSVLPDTILFFFQAEDGIRDLVRSRGLGDVYKRQVLHRVAEAGHHHRQRHRQAKRGHHATDGDCCAAAVSYTHLTLPTSDLV